MLVVPVPRFLAGRATNSGLAKVIGARGLQRYQGDGPKQKLFLWRRLSALHHRQRHPIVATCPHALEHDARDPRVSG